MKVMVSDKEFHLTSLLASEITNENLLEAFIRLIDALANKGLLDEADITYITQSFISFTLKGNNDY
jgi:hypothetical protein